MRFLRDVLSANRKPVLSIAALVSFLTFGFAADHAASARPATWIYRTNFVDLWDSDEACVLGPSIYITLATATQANVGFGDSRRSVGYKSYPLKNTAPYILALDDKNLPAPYLVINEEDHLEAWHDPGDKAPVCVYSRED